MYSVLKTLSNTYTKPRVAKKAFCLVPELAKIDHRKNKNPHIFKISDFVWKTRFFARTLQCVVRKSRYRYQSMASSASVGVAKLDGTKIFFLTSVGHFVPFQSLKTALFP